MKTLRPLRLFLTAIFIAVCIRFFFLDLVSVQGISMAPSAMPGSIALVSPLAYGIRNPFSKGWLLSWAKPETGHIILASDSKAGSSKIVKRVYETGPAWIGYSEGCLTLNEVLIPLKADERLRYSRGQYLPTGSLFLLGDNFEHSHDSRHYGGLEYQSVMGRVIFLIQGRGAS